jgi:hypothetical protein
MKTVLLSIFFFILIFTFCTKKERKYDSLMIMGYRNDLTIINNVDSTIIYDYIIDLDSDNVVDYRINFHYQQSQCVGSELINLYCLTKNCMVLRDDSSKTPKVLNYGDTLELGMKWVTDTLQILNLYGQSGICDGDGLIHYQGKWHDISDKYIGLMIKKQGYILLGWIKLSVFKNSDRSLDFSSIIIKELAFKKATYNNGS